MGRSRTLRYLVVALLIAVILLTAGASTARSKDPPGATVSQAGRALMTGGDYALTYQLQRAVCTPAGQSIVAATGGSYRLMGLGQPAASGSGCCCKCNLPTIRTKQDVAPTAR